jgi:hypothetical protein
VLAAGADARLGVMSNESGVWARMPYALSLVIAPALFTAADAFWVGAAEYGLTAGTLLVLGSVFWVVAFAGLASAIRPHAPRLAGWGLLLGAYGAICGGAAFGLQGVFNELYGVSHDQSLAALGEHPVVANVIFWMGGPAFPVTLLALACYLLVSRRAPVLVGVLLAAGAVLFPVARIPRIEILAMAIDLLILVPAAYLALRIARTGDLARRSSQPAGETVTPRR